MTTRSVLIIEDEPSISQSFRYALKKSVEYNYRINTVTSAEDAIKMIELSGPFDIILLDYYLPGMNGAEFLKTLRLRDNNSVVVCISASQDYRVVHDIFKLGADDFLAKEELANPLILEKMIITGLEKKQYQREAVQREITTQRLDAITTIIRTVHHELNNPMAIVRLASARMASSTELSSEEMRMFLKEVEQNVTRMSEVLKRLPLLQEEIFNEQLRGLKLYALPEEPAPQSSDNQKKDRP
ncbi:MAG: response regulator [Ignavibacteriales bacterium]|nr:response regulator [Ignavibacteriales bacterium]